MEHLGGARFHVVVSACANVAYSGRGQTYDKQVDSGYRWEVWQRPCEYPGSGTFPVSHGLQNKVKEHKEAVRLHAQDRYPCGPFQKLHSPPLTGPQEQSHLEGINVLPASF